MKELVLAVVLGSLLGFGLTGGYFAVKKNSSPPAKNSFKTVTPTTVSQTNSFSPSVFPQESLSTNDLQLTINSPENEDIVSNSQLTIKGSSSPNVSVIITFGINTYYLQSDETGNFSQSIELASGANLIQVDAIDNNDNQITQKMIVTYSTAKI